MGGEDPLGRPWGGENARKGNLPQARATQSFIAFCLSEARSDSFVGRMSKKQSHPLVIRRPRPYGKTEPFA